jgi:cytochrome c-type biogenesis protein CcmH
MATFLVFAALMIAAALAFVVVPLVRNSRTTTADTARRLRALEEAHASGLLDANEYATKRAALANAAPAAATPARRSRAAFASLLGVALLLPLSALLLYRLVGTPEALDPANVTPPQAEHSAGDMDKAIAGLAAKLQQEPNDPQGWALLARAYQAMNRLEESRDALRQAHEHAPDDNDLAVEYAQAIALAAPDHRLAGDARALLDAVLKKDPKNQRALWLSGIADYQDEKYPEAIATWKTLLPMLDADSDVARSVRNEIADAEARRDGREPPAPEQAPDETATAAANPGAPPEAVPSGGPKLTVSVTLDPKLANKLDSKATLFVFARAAKGPPMPLAIQRLKASQLPLTVTLDDSMSMMPQMSLSKFPEVVVGARVSKSGNAMPQSGDLQTLTPPLASSRAEPIALTIDQIVP